MPVIVDVHVRPYGLLATTREPLPVRIRQAGTPVTEGDRIPVEFTIDGVAIGKDWVTGEHLDSLMETRAFRGRHQIVFAVHENEEGALETALGVMMGPASEMDDEWSAQANAYERATGQDGVFVLVLTYGFVAPEERNPDESFEDEVARLFREALEGDMQDMDKCAIEELLATVG